MKDKFEEAIHLKLELAQKIQRQMQPDIEAEKLSKKTQEKIHLAIESLKAAGLQLNQGDYENAIYFFSRGCWNMGEVIGRSQIEKVICKEKSL